MALEVLMWAGVVMVVTLVGLLLGLTIVAIRMLWQESK